MECWGHADYNAIGSCSVLLRSRGVMLRGHVPRGCVATHWVISWWHHVTEGGRGGGGGDIHPGSTSPPPLGNSILSHLKGLSRQTNLAEILTGILKFLILENIIWCVEKLWKIYIIILGNSSYFLVEVIPNNEKYVVYYSGKCKRRQCCLAHFMGFLSEGALQHFP